MVLIWRITFLLVFAIFWGGLTFYTGFVVRVSHDVLSNPMDGGLITQRVTNILQMLGLIMGTTMVVNATGFLRLQPRDGRLLCIAAVFLISLIGLFVVHGHLDAVIDVDAAEITDRNAFVVGHRRYNQLTTVQWLSAVTYLAVTAFAWRSADSQQREGT